MLDLENLKALALAATPGPWIADQFFVGTTYGRHDIVSGASEILMDENAAYIAAANPATLLDIIARLVRVEAERDALTSEIECIKNGNLTQSGGAL